VESAVRCGTAVSGTRESGHADDEAATIARRSSRGARSGWNQVAQHGHEHPADAAATAWRAGLRVVNSSTVRDEQRRREDGSDLGDGVRSLLLNILSIRFVMRESVTMFVMEATARSPRGRG